MWKSTARRANYANARSLAEPLLASERSTAGDSCGVPARLEDVDETRHPMRPLACDDAKGNRKTMPSPRSCASSMPRQPNQPREMSKDRPCAPLLHTPWASFQQPLRSRMLAWGRQLIRSRVLALERQVLLMAQRAVQSRIQHQRNCHPMVGLASRGSQTRWTWVTARLCAMLAGMRVSSRPYQIHKKRVMSGTVSE